MNTVRHRSVRPFVLAGSVLGLAFLATVGTGAWVIHRMSDPATAFLAGIRVDGSRVSVKMPACRTDEVESVEVHDFDSEALLWRATGPKTPEGRRGLIALWNADGFREATPGTRPGTLPANLDVSVTFAGTGDGTGDVFDVRRARTAHLPDGQYWTRDGARTAAQIDAQFRCHRGG
ncbi:hypothetical protein [Streptomyces sp. NPDC051014]|uniref:hypothetical protein n=1 Tax=Streptomyces TaxID=1883 RepID=UPI0033EE7E96